KWIKVESAMHLRDRLVMPADTRQVFGIAEVGRRIGRSQRDRCSIFTLRGFPVPGVMMLRISKRGMRFPRGRIKLRGFACGGPRLWKCLARREDGIVRQQAIGICQPSVRRSVARIQLDCPLEGGWTVLELLRRLSHLRITTAQVSIVRIGIDRRGLSQAPLLGRGQPRSHLACDLQRYSALYCQNVAQVAVVAFRPEMLVLEGID